MPIHWKSELMLNQKPAEVLSPGLAFDVVQTSDGGAVYLSISTDQVFCMTREIQDSLIGWDHADQSSSLSSEHKGKPVVAKLFAVSQHPQSLAFDVALIVSVAGSDHLYISSNNPPDSVALGQGLKFAACPFDAPGKAGDGLQISDVFLMTIPGQEGGAAVRNCFVDVVREPGDPLQLLDRYYINMTAAPGTSRWNSRSIPIDLKAGSISCCLGQRARDRVPGIYTLGAIEGKKELIYTPQRNIYRPDIAPTSVSLALPTGATSMASSLDESGFSNLFMAANGGIYLWTSDKQGEGASPLQIIAADPDLGLLSDIKGLSVNTAGGRTQICGLNSQGDLVHMFCPAGSEASPSAWSSPMPLITDAQSYSYYLDSKTGHTVLFADHISAGLLQISENPVTTCWSERRVLLPPSSYENFTEYHSFTTHITVSDSNALPRAGLVELDLTAATPVSVYINNKYHTIGPASPLHVTTDEAGVLTVIQETQNLEATAFTVAVVGGDAPAQDVELIRPMNNLVKTLSSIKSGDDLGNVMIEADDGTEHPLLAGDVSGDAKNSAAQALTNLLAVNDSLPKDGSTKLATPSTSDLNSSLSSSVRNEYPTTWGVSFDQGAVKYVEGDEAMLLLVSDPKKRKRLRNAPGRINLGDIGDTIRAKAGALFRWLKRAWHKVTTFITREVNGIIHFLCKIGEKIYEVALDCYHAVAGALEYVFTQIKVFFQDLVRWLGFIFNWPDILRTHSVLKNLIIRSSENMIAQLDTIEENIEGTFKTLEEKLYALTDVTDDGETIGAHMEMAQRLPGFGLPQAKWGLYHAANGVEMATMPGYVAAPLADSVTDDVEALLGVLVEVVENEAEDIKTTIDQLKTQVIDNLQAQRPFEAMKKVLGILGGFLLKSARNIIVALVDIVKLLLKGFLDCLNAKIRIPVLSAIYRKITGGSELTMLDLFCLIGATAATPVFKLIMNRAPYPGNAHTRALIHAESCEAIRKLMSTSESSLTAVSHTGRDRHRSHHRHHHRHHHHHHHQHQHDHRYGNTSAQDRLTTDDKPEDDSEDGSKDSKYPSPSEINWTIAQAATNIAGPLAGAFLLITIKAPRTLAMRSCTLGAYVLFVSPNFIPILQWEHDWMTYMNLATTTLCIGKTAGDNLAWHESKLIMDTISPLVECVLNIAWFVPSCGWVRDAVRQEGGAKQTDKLSFDGALCGLGYAIASGFAAERWPPQVSKGGLIMVIMFTSGYCVASEFYGIGLLSELRETLEKKRKEEEKETEKKTLALPGAEVPRL